METHRSTHVLLATISLLLLGGISHGNVVSFSSAVAMRHLPPGISDSPLCLKLSTLVTGRCACYLVVENTEVKLRRRGMGLKRCRSLFGNSKIILKFKSTCNKFRNKGKINVKKLLIEANKVREACMPGDQPLEAIGN